MIISRRVCRSDPDQSRRIYERRDAGPYNGKRDTSNTKDRLPYVFQTRWYNKISDLIIREHFGRSRVDTPDLHILAIEKRHRPILRGLYLHSGADGVFRDEALLKIQGNR